jgi:sensor histidine kinase YesM
MLIQPLIENAVKHGISGLSDTGIIDVSFFNDDGVFTISVRDNGIGRAASKNNRVGYHSGKALSIIKERLELLNEKNNSDIHKIRFVDLEEDGKPVGTEVLITLMFRDADE